MTSYRSKSGNRTRDDLRETLARLDGRGYRAYEEIEGEFDFGSFTLIVDHTQRDPFAAPSRVRAIIPWETSGYGSDLLTNRARRIAAEDFIARAFRRAISRHGGGRDRGSGNSGRIHIDCGGQEVLERSSVNISSRMVECRFTVGLPAAGRRIVARAAGRLLLEDLPRVVEYSLFYKCHDQDSFRRHLDVVEDQRVLRGVLAEKKLVAFVADGAVLPRRSGVDDSPLRPPSDVVPFLSPPELSVTLECPHRGEVTGMGIPRGVILIVGGGFHGKSTLLAAIERGVYDHLPGDGREYVVSDPCCVKVRAEDGRRIEKVNISPFIRNLPFSRDTLQFSTDNASGSTSQAANIMEALEVGARLLLMDEDTSATNFMIRDVRMQALVSKEHEPITPYLDKVRQLSDELMVSTIVVMGGSGDYFDVADRVIMMDQYLPRDVTERALEVARSFSTRREFEGGDGFGLLPTRHPEPESFDASRGRREVRITSRGLRTIVFGTTALDLGALEQLVDSSQTRAIGEAIHFYATRIAGKDKDLRCGLEELDALLEEQGLDLLSPRRKLGDLARPRLFEIAAAVNRLRTLRVRRQ